MQLLMNSPRVFSLLEDAHVYVELTSNAFFVIATVALLGVFWRLVREA